MTGVEIAGVGLHPFGRFGDAPPPRWAWHAAAAALDDAGWSAGRAARTGGRRLLRHRLRRRGRRPPGARGRWRSPASRSSTWRRGARRAAPRWRWRRRRSAPASTTRCWWSASRRCPRGSSARRSSRRGRRRRASTPTPAYFALRAQRLLREHGLAVDDLAALVVKNRRWGAHNPDAMFRSEVTAEEVLASRMVCDPLRLWMLCSPNEGAAAVLLRRGDARRAAGGGRAAEPPARQRARRVDPAGGPGRRRRHHAAHHARRRRRLRGGRRRPRGPRRRRVPGHRRRPRAAVVVRARALRRRATSASCSGPMPGRASGRGRPSTARAGCCPRVSRSAPRRWARWSSWSASCAVGRATVRSPTPDSASRTRSAAAPTPASPS